jgi:two-component system, OmpR family, sensor histidine kinase ChvG
LIRRILSPIALKLLLFNVLLVFLPVAGLLSLRTLEQQLLDLQERSMVQQGRVAAAALAAEPHTLSADRARNLIQHLGGHSEARIRIVDRGGVVVADSASSRAAVSRAEDEHAETNPASRERPLYRIGVTLWRMLEAVRGVFERAPTSVSSRPAADATPRDVILQALAGRYGATLRESAGQRSLTLYSALPVRGGGNGAVTGVVLVSQSTSRILRALWRVRLATFEVFALSVAAAVVLSLLMSATIARPLIRLRNEADDLLDHRGRLRGTFRGSRRRDEIGDLTRALEKLTARLERHLVFVESFSADVSHEFKNPLASIRTAAELLTTTDDPREREQLGATIDKEVARLGRLLHGVREISKADAAVDREAAQPVDVRSIVAELAASRPLLELSAPPHPVLVNASEDRLMQAFGNVVANAISFSPDGGRVRVSIRQQDAHAIVCIDDEGPGIPPEHLERVFERFFTFRPGSADSRTHDGLGLAIARAIIEGYGGTIRAENLSPRGTRIEMRLPLVKG